jgi:hypothetical protein
MKSIEIDPNSDFESLHRIADCGLLHLHRNLRCVCNVLGNRSLRLASYRQTHSLLTLLVKNVVTLSDS